MNPVCVVLEVCNSASPYHVRQETCPYLSEGVNIFQRSSVQHQIKNLLHCRQCQIIEILQSRVKSFQSVQQEFFGLEKECIRLDNVQYNLVENHRTLRPPRKLLRSADHGYRDAVSDTEVQTAFGS